LNKLLLIAATLLVLTSGAHAIDGHFTVECTVISGSETGTKIGINYDGDVVTKGVSETGPWWSSRFKNYATTSFTKNQDGRFFVGMRWAGHASTKYGVDKSVTFVNTWKQDAKVTAKSIYTETLFWDGKVKSKTVSRCVDMEAD
jgi:hypothetical protein